MPLPSMRARLISAVTASNSWGGGAHITESQAGEIVDNILSALRAPDEAMKAAGGPAQFVAVIDAIRAQRPKAHVVAEAVVVVGNYPNRATPPVIGDYPA